MIMVNTLEFANDLPIHKEERGAEDRCVFFPFLPSVLIDSGSRTDA